MHHKIIAILIVCVLALTGCFEKQRLTAKWQNPDGTVTIEFLKNGDVLWTQPLGTVTGTWETVEGARIKVAFTGIAGLMGPQYCAYALADQKLTLSGDCILADTYARAKN